jgi:DNA ligase-1
MNTTIYKKDTAGNIRYLKIYTEGANMLQESGILGTDSPILHAKACKAKNVGRSNETTPEQQAEQEAKSKIKDKLTEGYFQSIKELESSVVILPMLAKSFKDEKEKIDWSCAFVQPKLDGMRCLAHITQGRVSLVSRQGKPISTMPHIEEDLSSIPNSVILDGELYVEGENFQNNMRAIKKYQKGISERVQFHIYDLVDTENPFAARSKALATYTANRQHLVSVETFQIQSENSLKEFHSSFLARGYEGSIVRWGKETYKPNGRSSHLLKYKDFLDIACRIIDIEPSESRPEWGTPVLEHNGRHFRAGMKFSHEERKEFLLNKHKYIGQTAEIRFFEYSLDGIPRFPVCVGLRLDK